jgi:hypothetical protein
MSASARRQAGAARLGIGPKWGPNGLESRVWSTSRNDEPERQVRNCCGRGFADLP